MGPSKQEEIREVLKSLAYLYSGSCHFVVKQEPQAQHDAKRCLALCYANELRRLFFFGAQTVQKAFFGRLGMLKYDRKYTFKLW